MTNPVQVGDLDRFCRAVLAGVGADPETARDCTASMIHGSIHGIDSHGVRLLGHYTNALQGGRLNKSPKMQFTRTRAGSGMLHSDNAQDARATYAAVDHACELAAEAGMGTVGITDASHFGPAGAYAMRAAQRGMLALVTCNSDSFVRLHDGVERFHGTTHYPSPVLPRATLGCWIWPPARCPITGWSSTGLPTPPFPKA